MNLGSLIAVAAVAAVVACGSSSGSPEFGSAAVGKGACQPGASQACPCTDAGGAAQSGSQVCSQDGTAFGQCACAGADTGAFGAGVDAAAGRCGDGTCSATESCEACASDCGVCASCSAAPSCSNAVGIPANPTLRSDLSQGLSADPNADAGAPDAPATCKDPQLRLRVASVVAHRDGGQIYCVISATDGAVSEVAVTAKTNSLGNGQTYSFDPTTALFWGQKELEPTTNNLTITYNCFRVKGDAWASVVGAMGDSAAKVGASAGLYGWVFGVGAVAADTTAAAIQAASGDTLVFNAQQVIAKSELLDLTNGRYWSVRESGGKGIFTKGWDWELNVQAWGCADAQTTTR